MVRRFSYPGTKREEEGRRSKEGEAAEMLRKEKAKAKKRQDDGERLRNRLYTALYDNRALEKKKILAFGKVTEPKTDEQYALVSSLLRPFVLSKAKHSPWIK